MKKLSEVPPSIPTLVPVFPLPDAVLFPSQMLPLFIFEPRYREMVADALSGERHIALALLKNDFESLYFTKDAPIHPVAGLGRVIAAERLAGGKFNLMLQGVARVQLHEISTTSCYRQAKVQRLCETPAPAAEVDGLRLLLHDAAMRAYRGPEPVRTRLALMIKTLPDIGRLVDRLAAAATLPCERKQALLAESCVCRRAARLAALLGELPTSSLSSGPHGACAWWEMN